MSFRIVEVNEMIQSRTHLDSLVSFGYVLCKWKSNLVSLKKMAVRSDDVQWLCVRSMLDYDNYGTENIIACRNWIEQIQVLSNRSL